MLPRLDMASVVAALPAGYAEWVGGRGATRAVTGARPVSALEDLQDLGAGHIVVVGADLVHAAGVEPLLARLDAAAVAGVVVCGDGASDLAAALGQRAGDVAVPLLAARPGATAADVHVALLDAIVTAQRERLDEAGAWAHLFGAGGDAGSGADAHVRFAAVTLEGLISGEAELVAAAVARAAGFGWDLDRPRAVLLASVDPPETGAIPRGALDTIAAAARATLGPDAIVWPRTNAIAALLAPAGDDPVERRRRAGDLQRELDARLRHATVSIGVGRPVAEPVQLARSLVEATRAVDVGRWAKGRHVTELYDELGLERVFASVPGEDLAQFVEHVIGPLLAHDRAQGTELVATLEVWLDTRNMAEAARRMHVHYNTLKYRLERVESILGPVLGDPARALECAVAIHVARHYDGPWSSGEA